MCTRDHRDSQGDAPYPIAEEGGKAERGEDNTIRSLPAFSISQAEVKILTRLDRPLPAECLRSVESLSALVGCPVSSACSLQKARHDMQMGLVMMVVISRLNENIRIMVVVMMATISYLPGRIKDCLASGLGMSQLCPDPCSPTSSAAAGATLH